MGTVILVFESRTGFRDKKLKAAVDIAVRKPRAQKSCASENLTPLMSFWESSGDPSNGQEIPS